MNDGVYDCSWSLTNQNHLVFSLGDGSARIWDVRDCLSQVQNENQSKIPLTGTPSAGRIIREFREHTAEIFAVDYHPLLENRILSGSWDHTLKIWDSSREASISTFIGHSESVYSAQWHHTHQSMFLSTSGDKTARIWDMNDSSRPAVTIRAHPMEVLSCAWNPTDSMAFYTGSVDKTIRVWDMRSVRMPLCSLEGHSFAVRKLCPSSVYPGVLASASYDMSVIVWDLHTSTKKLLENKLQTQSNSDPGIIPQISSAVNNGATMGTYTHHSEFVIGLDWSKTDPHSILSCAWDNTVHLWRV